MTMLAPVLTRRPRASPMCWRCCLRLALSSRTASRSFTVTSQVSTLHKAYFSANRISDASSSRNNVALRFSFDYPNGRSFNLADTARTMTLSPSSSIDTTTGSSAAPAASNTELPSRRRKRLKHEASEKGAEPAIAPDASAQLSTYSSAQPATSIRRKLAAFLALTKPRLSFLIVLTTTSAYGLYPISSLLTLDPSMTPLPTLSTSTLTLLYLTTGTFLSSCSANTLNMLFEPQYDAQMSRTRNRPLVRGLVSRRAAALFAVATALSGLGLLYIGINPTVTALSAGNIALYAFIYTPLKRLHVINTWVGAVVGAIPPLMGWVAAAGQTAITGHDSWADMLLGRDSVGGWLLAGVLFAWQFPHFNALSHSIRDEYRAAGYRMLAWTNPAMNARVALRYSLLMFPLCFGLWWVGVVGHGFLVFSFAANGWLVREAYRFWHQSGARGTARGLFWASVWQLPILLVGGLLTKKGLWDGLWRRAVSAEEEYVYVEDGEDENEEEEEEEVDKSAAVNAAVLSIRKTP